ncbi:MAG: anaerobic ribonucleoside-triphosphate reductase activating protein [Clostridia bacterium]|nr:anaerobic ribonucleoside-triphosphate reductase activating protein [Clostridia bacterium]
MNIAGLQKLTTSDFPGHLACIVFTQGCNLRCPYCQNSGLIPIVRDFKNDSLVEDDIFEFLEKRKGILDGVVITGGEPLIHNDINLFISKIKEIGYKVKLDTNGTNPELLQSLINQNLIDYVAMDIKNDFPNYAKTVGVENINTENIKKSIDILKHSKIDYEFRTTIVKEFHNIESITNICELIGKEPKYFIQNFEDSSNVINHDLHGFTFDDLVKLQKYFETRYPNFYVRGV